MSTDHLRFAPEILRRLGEELVPHPDVGITELVRNAYDADATICRVRLEDVSTPGGCVVITDDGRGLSSEQIRDGWLLIGQSGKAQEPLSPSGRRRVGEKGLGRLAALRLGSTAVLQTWPEMEPGNCHELAIDWNLYDNALAVEDVPLSIVTSDGNGRGTRVTISALRTRLSKTDVRRLARAMVMLTGPFPTQEQFRAELDAPEYQQLEKIVSSGFFDEHEYLLKATLSEDGEPHAELRDWTGKVLAKVSGPELKPRRGSSDAASRYSAPPATFEMWLFSLTKETFQLRHSAHSLTDVRQWLSVVGGVHLIHRGLRVSPYGDPGHDWLDLNLRRARSPELRPSTNTSVGRMVVESDAARLLTPKTDRSGFVEDESFHELRRFGQDVLDWAADVRLKEREKRRGGAQERAKKRVEEASEQVAASIREIPAKNRPPIQEAVAQYAGALEAQLKVVEEDLRLYRTLGSVGTTTAVFAHETLRPVAAIEQAAGTLRRRGENALRDDFEDLLERPLRTIEESTGSLRTFAELPLKMLRRSKRRLESVDVNAVVGEVLQMFAPYLRDAGVEVEDQRGDEQFVIFGTIADVEAILSNLIANAVYFMGDPNQLVFRERRIFVRSTVNGATGLLSVLDTGPGIRGLSVDDVWLPGNTTRQGGTGFGLTIVRDVALGLSGAVHAVASGEYGGAEVHVSLPVRVEDSSATALSASAVGQ